MKETNKNKNKKNSYTYYQDDGSVTLGGQWNINDVAIANNLASSISCNSYSISSGKISIRESPIEILKKDIEKINKKLEKFESAIGVMLEEPSSEKLEKHKALKDAYLKYKFLEALIGEEEQNVE